MRACMVAYTFYESDNRVRRYGEALVRRGDDVDVIALRKPGQPAFEVIKGVSVRRIQMRIRDEKGPLNYLGRMLLFFLRSTWILTLQHLRRPYDLIHVHSLPDFQVFATVVPHLMGVPVILDIHDIVPEFYASKFNVREQSLVFRALLLIEKLSTYYASHVIISNHLWHSKLLERAVPAEKCTTIINYPDRTIFRKPQSVLPRNASFTICYPGTLNWHQGLDIAVKAIVCLRDSLPGVKLVIIGDGPELRSLQMMVEKEGLAAHVAFIDPIPLEQVADVLAGVQLGVVPKRNSSFGGEAFSTKILEFMAMGVPAVVSRTRIDEYYFADGLVQFFEPENAEELARKILLLATHPDNYEAQRASAAAFIEQNNWDVRKTEYFDLIENLTRPKFQQRGASVAGVQPSPSSK